MRALRLVVAAGVLVASMAFAAPVAAGDPCYHGFEIPTRSEASETQIKMMPCAFAPTVTRVKVGATVEWFSGPDFVHLLTGANQEWGSRDVEVQPDSVVAYRFDKPGVYPYACALHRGMSGTIIVGDGVASSTGGGAAVVAVKPPEAAASTVAASPKPIAAAPSVVAAPPAAVNGSGATERTVIPAIAIGIGGLLVLVIVAAVILGSRQASRRQLPENRT